MIGLTIRGEENVSCTPETLAKEETSASETRMDQRNETETSDDAARDQGRSTTRWRKEERPVGDDQTVAANIRVFLSPRTLARAGIAYLRSWDRGGESIQDSINHDA